ncbi:hypothetical protein [Niveispirillum sp.]|uniref:hypothetical protein n=1 Tax=Niveispirillum sp. TaxID=1917217 RepID=UPI0040362093
MNKGVEGAFRTRLANAVSAYTLAGYAVVTSAESFFGPGSRIGYIKHQNIICRTREAGELRTVNDGDPLEIQEPEPGSLICSHFSSKARGGALIETKYDEVGVLTSTRN